MVAIYIGIHEADRKRLDFVLVGESLQIATQCVLVER